MPDITKVEVGNATLFVEARHLGPGSDLDRTDFDGTGLDRAALEGPDAELEGLGGRLPDLAGVTEALTSFAGQIGEALHRADPDRATVEFGCQLGLDAGKLTALVVQGSANASLRVTLEWVKSSR
ncbi:CU044_2847 family protein [Streptomyces sp. NPDC049602]|uniref:CU044_2847 family protein n=1 Tax=Streptomyces sp. NPDC049602 TaxID=3155504 RepID=UPI003444C24C